MGLTRIRAEQISDIDYKQAVRVITVTNVTLSGGAPATVDGVNLVADDRVLVAGQNTGSQNGLYYVQTVGAGNNGTWVRTTDGNETGEIEAGMIVMVTEGDVYKDTQWKLTTNNPIVIGTTALTFEQNSAFAFGNIYANGTAVLATTVGDAVTFTAGNNIAITGNNTSKTVTIGVTGISLSSIANGTSNVNVISSGGNVTVGVGGTNDIAVFSTGGANVTGYVTATGNITSANLQVNNNAVITGNLTVNGNLTYINSNVVTINDKFINVANNAATASEANGGGLGVGPVGSEYATLTYDNAANTWDTNIGISATGIVSATANITGGNLITAGLLSVTGNANVGNLGATNANITAITATGNANVGNLGTAGLIVATGNVTGGNLVTGGQANITGNLTTANAVNFNLPNSSSTDVTVSSGLATAFKTRIGTTATNQYSWRTNLYYTGAAWQKDDATRGAWRLNQVCLTGNANSVMQFTYAPIGSTDVNELMTLTGEGLLTVTGNISAGNISTTGIFSATGNANVGNLGTAGLIVATGNITGGNLNTAAQVVATGNITGGNVLGSALFATSTTANAVTARLTTGNDNNFRITAQNGVASNTTGTEVSRLGINYVGTGWDSFTQYIRGSAAQNGAQVLWAANTAIANVNSTGVGVTGIVTATGNVSGGNITTAGRVDATGNITGGNLNTGAQVIATGNITGGNLTTVGQVAATGNITGGNILGNGAGLSGINVFSNVTVTGGNSAVADSISDTLTLTAGDGIAITIDSTTDTVTFAVTGGSEIFVDGADFGTVTEAVTLSDDLGTVDAAVDQEADLGTIVTAGIFYPDQLVLPSKTVAELANTAATPAGQFVFCSNESGGSVPAFSDGTNWRRVTDRAIVT